jgi:hypothetical protein
VQRTYRIQTLNASDSHFKLLICLDYIRATRCRTQQYFIGRMLMLRERLAPAPWASFERTAEAICDSLLERMPIDHPGSAVWDNRRTRPSDC